MPISFSQDLNLQNREQAWITSLFGVSDSVVSFATMDTQGTKLDQNFASSLDHSGTREEDHSQGAYNGLLDVQFDFENDYAGERENGSRPVTSNQDSPNAYSRINQNSSQQPDPETELTMPLPRAEPVVDNVHRQRLSLRLLKAPIDEDILPLIHSRARSAIRLLRGGSKRPKNPLASTLMHLPVELHLLISGRLRYRDALALKSTCRYFHQLVDPGERPKKPSGFKEGGMKLQHRSGRMVTYRIRIFGWRADDVGFLVRAYP